MQKSRKIHEYYELIPFKKRGFQDICSPTLISSTCDISSTSKKLYKSKKSNYLLLNRRKN